MAISWDLRVKFVQKAKSLRLGGGGGGGKSDFSGGNCSSSYIVKKGPEK